MHPQPAFFASSIRKRRSPQAPLPRTSDSRNISVLPKGVLGCSSGKDSENDGETSTLLDKNYLIESQVQSSRSFRQTGVLVGSLCFSLAISVGTSFGILDSTITSAAMLAILASFGANTLSHNESRQPLPDSAFQVRESRIPNAGNGLFACHPISKGSYLMDYEGEVLTEAEYFGRYPDGQGRYVAVIPEPIPLPGFGVWSNPTYIDGSNVRRSNLARYMNSRSDKAGANVIWRKQRFGPRRAMHFYALEDIRPGDELCFDYGSSYWDAVVKDEDE